MKTIFIKLGGLTCIACKKVTERKISTISGVNYVNVEFNTGQAEIHAERDIIKEEIENVLKDTAYKVII